MAITKVSRGLLSTGIVDNSNATAITLNADESATFSGALTANGGIDVTGLATASEMTVSDTDDIRLRFLNGTTFKAGLQVATSTGDMISGSAVDDLAIRSQANMLFSAGGNTEAMRISGGNVGISTSDPKSTLEVKGTFGAPATSGSAAGFISRFSQTSGVGCLDVGFGDPYSWIQSRASNNYATNFDLILQPNGGQLSLATTEDKARMTIGLTGVAVAGDTDGATMGENAIVHLLDSNAGAANSTVMLLGGGGGATGQIKSGIGFSRESAANWGTQLRFYTHSTSTSDLDELKERMRINSEGRVGIGLDPVYKLDVLNTTANVVGARFTSTATSSTEYGPFIILTNDPNDTVRYLLAGGSPTTNRFVIYSNGNIKNQNNSKLEQRKKLRLKRRQLLLARKKQVN